MKLWIAGVAVLVSPAAAAAAAAGDPSISFAGPYAGGEVGIQEHHFYLTTQGVAPTARYYRKWGVGGGAFAGYDWAVAARIRIGGEAAISFGGDNPVARFSAGTYFTERPRYGYRLTIHAGYLAAPDLMVYATGGYGGHRYALSGAIPQGAHEWGSSFVVGGGAEYRLGKRIGLRLDFKHLDNQTSQLQIGIPIRF